MVDYGIHPIFRLHDERKKAQVNGFSRDGSVVAFSEKGELICAAHRDDLPFVGFETPGRGKLYPGQRNEKEGGFRIRARCSKGCGDVSLRMKSDWSRLTAYPHHDHGSTAKKRYAMRLALLTRLNGMEGIFNRLQSGWKLGTKGAGRTRIRDKAAHESIVSLALLSMTAATVADQRQQLGIDVEPITNDGPAEIAGPAVAVTTSATGPVEPALTAGTTSIADLLSAEVFCDV